MPCFKGLAVSIHTPSGPLPEYSIQKQSRSNRISSYIPVPPPKFTTGSDRPEQSSFAISVTLLTPGSSVPYSKPAATGDDPYPTNKLVGGLPGFGTDRGRYTAGVAPYVPLTSSPNETVAAYIHFDGRQKEEVATLLRKGVETWVNSRWVGVPESEGGGLAEREFLFREVGLERWLNGLDLKGGQKEVAAKIEKRKQKLEKKRRKKLMSRDSDDEDDTDGIKNRARPLEQNGVLRYGNSKSSPVENVSDNEGMWSSSDDSSEDEMPEPEATGQIKVSLFRVMASGEIKKGEYSPSFDAHDDEDEGMHEQNGDDPDVDHTTSFAKPKTLDPKSISTQTVTGIDDPSKPYATFTFLYRGERQLQKMGMLPTPTSPEATKTSTAKRKSRQIDLSGLKPLKSAAGFEGYRERRQKNGVKHRNDDDEMDSDADDDEDSKAAKKSPKMKKESVEDRSNGLDGDEESKEVLSQEETRKRAELADGVKKIQLKRQHSFDPTQGRPISNAKGDSTSAETHTHDATSNPNIQANPTAPSHIHSQASRLTDSFSASESFSSPFKKPRASVSDETSPNTLNHSSQPPPTNPHQNQTSTPSSNPPTTNTTSATSATAPPLSIPDISFTPTTASQPTFSSSNPSGDAKISRSQSQHERPNIATTAPADERKAVPPPPVSSPAVGAANADTNGSGGGRAMDEDEEL